MSTNNEDLPKDLGGWQAISRNERLREGDMWVLHGAPKYFIKCDMIGDLLAEYPVALSCGWNIYRKLPVAKQGDTDPTWKDARTAASTGADGKAATHDDGKPPLARLPWKALDEMANVQAYGYGKYGEWDNWKRGLEVTRNASCALRHIRDYLNGCNEDHESKCHPLAHAMIRLAYIIENEIDGRALDDRSKPISDNNGGRLGQEPSPSEKTP